MWPTFGSDFGNSILLVLNMVFSLIANINYRYLLK